MNNRIIRFRAWDKREKKIRYDFAIDSSGRVLETGHSCDYQCDGVEDVTDDWIAGKGYNETVWNIMQFTGFKDSKGTPIFEGDILKSYTHYHGNKKEHISVIKWEIDSDYDGLGEFTMMGYNFRVGDVKVIGNIYQNPELLK